MERICRQTTGLFPSPAEIEFSCSCPDWASMCKHVAAVFYGIGARLDAQPELLFKLRKVDERDLLAGAGAGLRLAKGPAAHKVLGAEGLSSIFGLDLAEDAAESPESSEPGTKVAGTTAPVGKRPGTKKKAAPVKAVKQPMVTGPGPGSGRQLQTRRPRGKPAKKSNAARA